jgi:hypothetical protein
MDPLTSLKLIELRHQELRAEAARARRPVGTRRVSIRRAFVDLVQAIAGQRRTSRAARVQSAR